MSMIVFVKPVATNATELTSELNRWTRPETTLSTQVAEPDGPDNLEYHAYETIVAPKILTQVAAAEHCGADAVIIGCFYDTALAAAREIATIPVVAPCQSAVHIAALLGTRSAIIVGRRKWIPRMRANVAAYGFAGQVACFPSLELGVPQLQHDPQTTYVRMLRLGRDAIERDGVDVLILGCTIEYGFAPRLQADLHVPVIDAARAALKYAEMAAELHRIGWSTSKAGGYAPPPQIDLHPLLEPGESRRDA